MGAAMKVTLFLVLIAVACVCAQDELIDKLIIDDFTVGADQHSLEISLATTITRADNSVIDSSSFSSPGCSGLIGCERDIQIEGLDGTFDLDTSGLGGIDITDGGFTTSLFFSAVSDIRIEYTILFYDVSGGICELDVDVPASAGNYNYDDTFYLFDVDAIVRQIKLVGNPPPGAPPPPPPPGPGGFTWYTFDDDDNGRPPCGDERPRPTYFVSDDNIIYYYFFGVNDGIDFGDDSASSASMLTACVALIVSVVAFIF